MRWLLAVDPGVDNPAFAYFVDAILVIARRVAIPESLAALGPVDRCEQIARRICAAVAGPADALVIEQPQFYRASRSKGDPNKLALLVLVNGAVAALARQTWGSNISVDSPYPAQWAGQIPKSTKKGEAWKSPRGRLIRGQISHAEFIVCENNHDSVDAVGLGLWKLGRLFPASVYPGATG